MRCLFRLDPQFTLRRRHLRADSRSGRLGRHALIGSSLAGLLCANEEEANLPASSAIVIAITKDLEAFVFSMATSMFPIADRELWFQHGSERQSKEARSRKVPAIYGAGPARSRPS